jgi:hypothetical protein
VNYDVGDSVKLTARFTDDDGAAADPDGITATVRSPSGVETDYTIASFTHPALGTYELTVVADESGTWTWRIAGSGAVTAASEGQFYVTPSSFP